MTPSTDPLAAAHQYRQNTRSPARKVPRRDWNGLEEDGLTARLALEEGEERAAARDVARFTMRDAHGCTGRKCTSEAHDGDRQVMHQVLAFLRLFHYAAGPDVLGLGQPEDTKTDEWGRRLPERRRAKRGQPAPLRAGWLVMQAG